MVLVITNGDGTLSYYNYDPSNPNANSAGYVGSGIESCTETPVVVTAETNANAMPWLAIGLQEVGVREADPGNNPRILEYHSSTDLFVHRRDADAWCSSFVNWCVEQSGKDGTNSAAALSWERWGRAIANPITGSIAVKERIVVDKKTGKKRRMGHVGIVYGGTPDGKLLILGGNQGDAVSIVKYSKTAFTTFRLPSDYNTGVNDTLTIYQNANFGKNGREN